MKSVNRHFLAILTLVCVVMFSTLTVASEAEEVGYIEGFNGPGKAYALIRGKEKLDVALFMPLQSGDWICIRERTNERSDDKENRILLNIGGKSIVVRHEEAPLLIEESEKPPSLAGNLMRWATGLFVEWHDDHYMRSLNRVHTVSRGDTAVLSIPLLDYENARISVGKQALFLSWLGGKPPFKVEVFQEGQLQLTFEGITGRQSRLDRAVFEPGKYRVEIIDADSNSAVGQFVAVATDSLPQMPSVFARELRESTLSPDAKTTLYAAWLSVQGDREWMLEAYQHVAPLAEGYAPAMLLRASLEEGG